MGISDRIEAFITELLKNESGEWLELGRNELAELFHCVPSQVNYVIRTRFSPERGYIVESRRGGGGCLKIKYAGSGGDEISQIGDSIDFPLANAIIHRLFENGSITKDNAEIMRAAVSDKSIPIGQPHKNIVRASILKNMLIQL